MDGIGRAWGAAVALLVTASVAVVVLSSPKAAATPGVRLQPPRSTVDTHSVLGITVDGHIGRFGPDGQWHPATALETAGIGPTEGTHLPLLG
jgi:hypothetical protein